MAIGNREKFLRIYANLPMGIRQDIIFVSEDGKTLSWDTVFFEVDNDTKLSKTILKKLSQMEII